MVRIGIGGNIGSGKTSVVKELIKLYQKDNIKAKLIDADQIAWKLYEADCQIYKKIVRVFGKHILDKNNKIDRKKLGSLVFNNKAKLQKLNQLVHPTLIKNIKHMLSKNNSSVKILDAALLFLWVKKLPVDILILVTAPEKQKIARMKKRGYNPKEVKIRLQNQMKEKEMEKSADFVINNNGILTELKKKIKTLYEIIKQY